MWFKGVDFFPHHIKLNVMRWRKVCVGISVALCVISALLLGIKGFNYGVDFKGGSILEVQSKSGALDIAKLRETMGGLGLGSVQIQGLDKPAEALIRVEQQPGGEAAQQAAANKVRSALGANIEVRRVEVVGPSVSRELKFWGAVAVVAAMFGILLYVWFRFEWQFAVAGVLALWHDVLITMGLFSLLNLEFGLTEVAAILTLAGYSINDTVVVFDRVRENLRRYKKMSLYDILDQSINETLSRTVLTAGSVFLAVLALYYFGTEVIQGFAIAMIFGSIIGSWSSIFVAAPLVLLMGVRREHIEGTKATGTVKV